MKGDVAFPAFEIFLRDVVTFLKGNALPKKFFTQKKPVPIFSWELFCGFCGRLDDAVLFLSLFFLFFWCYFSIFKLFFSLLLVVCFRRLGVL